MFEKNRKFVKENKKEQRATEIKRQVPALGETSSRSSASCGAMPDDRCQERPPVESHGGPVWPTGPGTE